MLLNYPRRNASNGVAPRDRRPLLLAGFLGIAATGAAKALAHSLSFAVMLAVTTNLLQYSCWRALAKGCVCRMPGANVNSSNGFP